MRFPMLSMSSGSLAKYLSEINQFSVLTIEQEQLLARRYRAQKDPQVRHVLVTSNLRFVVKIAFEYRSYAVRMPDIIQEGNIGLMMAVQKFDPEKGVRLISYAAWWIRAYIQNYILKSWSLVKVGTTQAQRKLFFSLARAKREIENINDIDVCEIEPSSRQIAKRLRVKQIEVIEMEQRLAGRDFSLDAPIEEEGRASHIDFIVSGIQGQDEELSEKEESRLLASRIKAALSRLDLRERFIIENRVMSDNPMSVNEIIQHFGFSRERARQLEIRAKKKLKQNLKFFRK